MVFPAPTDVVRDHASRDQRRVVRPRASEHAVHLVRQSRQLDRRIGQLPFGPTIFERGDAVQNSHGGVARRSRNARRSLRR
jgi:hypothetical protein